MSFGDQMKQKADEVHLQDKAKDLGDAVAEVVKAAVGMASTYAAENRPKVDGMLDKAESKIGEKAGPKHAETIAKARSKVDQGLDKVSEKAAETDGPTAADATASPIATRGRPRPTRPSRRTPPRPSTSRGPRAPPPERLAGSGRGGRVKASGSPSTQTLPASDTSTVTTAPATRRPLARMAPKGAALGGRTVTVRPGTSTERPSATVTIAIADAAAQAWGRQDAG